MPKFEIRLLLFIFLQLSLYYVNNSHGFANFNMNPQTKFSQIRGQNFPSNKKFDAAKQAMNLITMIDLPTCRCVNTLAPQENLQCEVRIPPRHLRILNLDCRKVLGCSQDVPINDFGVCCRRRKVIKPYISPNDLKQLLATLGRFKNSGSDYANQQCYKSYQKVYNQNLPIKATIEQIHKAQTSKDKGNQEKVDPVVQKRKILTSLLIEKDAQTKANVRLASEVVKKNQESISNNNSMKSGERFLKDEKSEPATAFQEEERCKCLPNDDCPTDQKDFTFGISCKIGMVRCCSTTKTIIEEEDEEDTTTVNSNIDLADEFTPSTATLATTTLLNPQTFQKASTELKPRISNHRESGQNATLKLPNQDLPYRRYATPITDTSYYHRIQMSRPNTFYQNLDNMKAVLVTQKPKYYHPNDGRFVKFSPNSQKLNLKVHSENGNFKSKPVKAINERNFEVINTLSPSNVQTISTEMEETEKRELEVINRGTQSSSIPSREEFKEKSSTIYEKSQNLPKAQNRNMKIDGEELEDGYNRNNNEMAHQNTRYQNYQISSRSTNIEQQNEERKHSQ